MPGFELTATCRAPAEEVFKLLHDPARFPDWWAGIDRVESGPDGTLTRYMEQWPGFPYPTRVAGRAADGAVTVSCLLSDIVHEWRLAPDPAGCAVRVRVEVPEAESARLEAQRAEVAPSLDRLVAVAEREAGQRPASW